MNKLKKTANVSKPAIKVTYYPYAHAGERSEIDATVWNWHQVLIDVANTVIKTPSNNLSCADFAPIGAFGGPPMKTELLQLSKGSMVEVELPVSDEMRVVLADRPLCPVWIAEVIHMAGYFVMARWVGAKPSDGVFWIHAANVALKRVGFTTDKPNQYLLFPPHSMTNYMSPEEWVDYTKERVIGRYSPDNRFDKRRDDICKNKFKVNTRVETIHEDDSILVPAIIKRVLGRRVLVEYSNDDIDKPINHSVWMDMDDDLIYPVGFAQSMGLRLMSNGKYRRHGAAIAQAIKNGEDVPYSEMDATPQTVFQWRDNVPATAVWKENMVCEMIDRLDACQNVLKAARVIKVLPDGFLQVGPDGPDIVKDSLYLHQSTWILFPAGYAKKHKIPLQGPNTEKETTFEWASYFKRTNYRPAPYHFFHETGKEDIPFKEGMRLEAVDQNEKIMCPVTVKAIKGRLVLVGFDGWEEDFDHLYDFRSNELLPCGWSEMIGHTLQPPVKTTLPRETHQMDVDTRAFLSK